MTRTWRPSGHATRAVAALALLVAALGCQRPSDADPATRGKTDAPLPTASAPREVVAEAAAPEKFDPAEGERVLQSVNRLPLVDKACRRRRCSLAVDNDGEHWLVEVGSDRSPAPLTPLHLFSVVVERGTEKTIGVIPAAMYGFCLHPIDIEDWDRYSAQYERYLDGKGREPECP